MDIPRIITILLAVAVALLIIIGLFNLDLFIWLMSGVLVIVLLVGIVVTLVRSLFIRK